MNSPVTQCPSCFTSFRVTQEQLTAHNGMVRCGRCSSVFNASEHLNNDDADPHLTLPTSIADNKEFQLPAIADDSHPEKFILPSGDSEEFETLFQQIEFTDESPAEEVIARGVAPRRWPWISGSLILSLLILAQGLYFFRVEIAAKLPGIKPALSGYCDLLKCSIPLPEKVELMSIESSDLVAEPLQPNVVTLSALLHNRAEYILAYPNIELSLTDTQDKILARRVFFPSDYLPIGDSEKTGLGANRDLNIQLHLDSGELRPSGYKLLLFFPQNTI